MSIKLSVITSYRERIKNFYEYAKHVKVNKNDNVEYILVSLGDNDLRVKNECEKAGIKYHYEHYKGIFSNGYGHNIAAKIATGEWIFKVDVDCIIYEGFIDKLLVFLNKYCVHKTDFLNLGCYFTTKDYRIKNNVLQEENVKSFQKRYIKMYNKEPIGGMLYIINREHYINIGGIPDEFIGYGWEDYYIIYLLKKMQDNSFKLSEYSRESLHVPIRKEIARPVTK